MFDFDNELAKHYGGFASYPSEASPSLVEYYGENPTGEIDRLLDHYAASESTILDVGWGTGHTLCRLAPAFKHIWGIDLNEELISAARLRAERLGLGNVTVVCGNIVDMESVARLPNAAFDLAVKDQAFAERLYADLQAKDVRCWYAPEDLKIGDEFRTHIDEAIRVYDKLIVILSQHSVESSWVEYEVRKALKKEQEQGKPVLFPIKLDETIMETPEVWAAAIRKKRHIGDFVKWKEHDAYQAALQRLLRDLRASTIPPIKAI